jgi:ABC-type lipoprotein release transport system permease subunit
MLQNYLKIALRKLRKHQTYSVLNVLGLGLSVAWRVVTELHLENLRYSSGVPYPMSETLRREFSFVKKAATVDGYGEVLVSVPGAEGVAPVKFKEVESVAYAEPEVFEILHFPLIKGDIKAFFEPNTALITQKTALKYFGTEDAVGRIFRAFEDKTFRVAGILADMPANTDCGRAVFCSWASLQSDVEKKSMNSWGNIRGNTRCYVSMQDGHSLDELAAALPEFSKKFPHPVRKEAFIYRAFSLSDLHFDPRFGGTFEKKHLWALGFIGFFLLLTACVNFVNMATAQSLSRAREVGVRKSLGSTKAHLFGQFMLETAILVTFSLIFGTFLARLALPHLNEWTHQQLHFGDLLQPDSCLFVLLLGGVLVLLSGAYPGFLLARFQAAQSLKGEVVQGGFSLRRGLVAAQFAISQLMIIVAVVLTAQMRFALDSDWGFQHEAIVTIPVPDASKRQIFGQQLANLPGIQNLSFCSAPPATDRGNQTFLRYENRSEAEKWTVFFSWGDENFCKTFNIPLAAGQNFWPGDSVQQCLVNETFIKNLNAGPAESVVGTRITIADKDLLIAGVLRDFHINSFRENIPPLLIQPNPSGYAHCALQLSPGNPEKTLAAVQSVWNGLFPDAYYEYAFFDEQLGAFYRTELTSLRLANTFAAIAIFIAALGLFGLTAYLIARSAKEIGIRKVLGASISGILWLFGREYVRLIALGLLVAAPLGGWLMHRWLADFAYRIEIQWWMFALAGAGAVLIALVTVGFQSVKAALANPVHSLKSE